MRLFYAVEIPAPLRDGIGRLQSLLREAGADVRWTDPATAHFTLKFLGEVPPTLLAQLDAAVAPALSGRRSPRLRLQGLGAFPDARRPRVVWLGVAGETALLADLQRALEDALESLGFARERRRFHPHVTLGRVRGARGLGALAELLRRHGDADAGALRAHEVVLMRSYLSPHGSRYERLGGYALGT